MAETNPAIAAIAFALQRRTEEPIEFLRCWFEGNFDSIRKEWPDAPEAVFIGADPLHPLTPSNACAADRGEVLFTRALEIADESMTELLRSHAKRADEHGVSWALVDEDGGDVATLAEADPAVIEAVEWLQERGLCEVVESPQAAMVVLTLEVGQG